MSERISRRRLFPEGVDARAAVGSRPVARVTLKHSPTMSVRPVEYYAAMGARATTRTEYTGPLIQQEEFARILQFTAPRACMLELVVEPQRMQRMAALFQGGMDIETRTVKRADESRVWFRFSDREIREKRDGISLRGNGMAGFKLWLVSRFFLGRDPSSFHSRQSQDSFLDSFREVLKSSRGYILMRTRTNAPADWVNAGRDYASLQLALTMQGLVMSPLSQVLQEYPEMDALRRSFEGECRVKPGEKIQMVVRVGRSNYHYISPRRAARDMLVRT